ncbi:molecular chaperone Hsp90 [Pseudofrankia sp. BMG5.36]|uniref:sacsin N-terminal ATP-binding-like domain-containing protein n=1 Tax=Pseudofrankia sp. BMG5.36 TaxID=1834512 RepID=UPI0008D9DD7E|nr:molecular chaperone Hsp90 [Pseudofrankia sp. BMG5.36]OHV68253.1 molecular chaperone Hsp90 [Pseudofrankia sp. BMG5.36]
MSPIGQGPRIREVGDPFGTAAIRGRVLDAWAASPARFREDANAEEDAALGAYRDRLVAELLQNAVDAAAVAGVAGRVLIRLAGDQLEVANTGAPLTAAGVEALSTLRASAKRDTGAIGRFGAGFAAVLAVSDEPSIVSRNPAMTRIGEETPGGPAEGPSEGAPPASARGVRWSKEWTVAAVHEIGAAGLRAELARRDGAAPTLRLPFAVVDEQPPPDGYDTVVRLPLRDAEAATTARELLAAFDPTLLLVLPGLVEAVLDLDGDVQTHTCHWEYTAGDESVGEPPAAIADAHHGDPADPADMPLDAALEIALLDGERWRGCVRRGTIPAALLADRPVEERARTGYAARAMVRDRGWPASVPKVVRAPQPTDEPLSLPVLASVELPLEPSRRHTVAGPLRDWLTDRLAEAVVALAVHLGAADADVDATADGTPAPGGDGEGRGEDLFAAFAASGPASGEGHSPAPIGADPGVPVRSAEPIEQVVIPPDPLAALELVPSGLPAGPVDGRLRDAVARMLPEVGMMPGGRLGRECVVCDLGPATDAVTALLSPAAGGAVVSDQGVASSPAGTPGPEIAAEDSRESPVAGLLPARYAARHWRRALDALGVRRLDSAGLVDVLAGLRRPPAWWSSLYAALITAPDRDALGALPVPVATVADGGDHPDGAAGAVGDRPALRVRMVTGPRGVLLPTEGLDVMALAASGLPLRVVHPDACLGAARDALRTLGAVEGTPAGVLRDPAVHEAVVDSDPDDDPEELLALAAAVLALVRDADLSPADTAAGLDWLGELLLPDTESEFVPSAELLIADGPLDRLVAGDTPFGILAPEITDAWSTSVLEAVGVLRTFGVLYASDVTLDPDEPVLLDLDDSDTWVEEAVESPALATARAAAARAGGRGAPVVLAGFAAVRDLELVDPAAWPEALAELAQPPLRGIVLDDEPSYTRWWLARHALLPIASARDTDAAADADADADADRGTGEDDYDDRDRYDREGFGFAGGRGGTVRLPPPELRLPGADPLLAGLFAPAAPLPGVDAELLRALGCRLTLGDVLGDVAGVLDLLDRLGDVDRDVPWPSARALYVAAVTAATRLAAGPDGEPGGGLADGRLDPPLTVRTPRGVVPTRDAVVLDAPDLLTLLGDAAPLRVPLDRAAEIGHVLGVPLASASADCAVLDGPYNTAERQAPDGTPYVEHARLVVADLAGRPAHTPWRVVGGIGGEVHVDAAAGTDALARALAWRAGTWHRRHALAAALRDPDGTAFRDAEDDLDDEAIAPLWSAPSG